MSETKEQFLENLASASLSAFAAYKHKALVAGESADMATSVGWCGAAEAVYAQAVRDVMTWLDDIDRDAINRDSINIIHDGTSLYEAIEHLLHERGIDMDGGE